VPREWCTFIADKDVRVPASGFDRVPVTTNKTQQRLQQSNRHIDGPVECLGIRLSSSRIQCGVSTPGYIELWFIWVDVTDSKPEKFSAPNSKPKAQQDDQLITIANEFVTPRVVWMIRTNDL